MSDRQRVSDTGLPVNRDHPAAGRGTPAPRAHRDLDVRPRRAAPPSRVRGGGDVPADLLALQGLAGNNAVAALLDTGRPWPAGSDPGTPLPGDVRGRLEHAFGVPLDHVRLHRGADAARTAQALDARAFTVGEHIGFPPRLSPGSADGERLLAHEVAHVVQQGPQTGNTGTWQRTSRGDGTERSAEQAAGRAARGQRVGPLTAVRAPGPLVARDGVFSALEWLGDKATQTKEAGYHWLIERLRALHRAGIARLMSYGDRLTGTQRTLWQGIVGAVDMTMTILEGLVYAVVGIVAGFVTGILQMLVGLLRMLVGVCEGILRFLYGFIDGGKAYDEWVTGVARTISLIPQGLRMLVDDWLAEFRTASPEKAGLMIGELTGQILAFLATLGVSAGKAGSAAQSVKLVPKLAALIETTPGALATTTGITVPLAVEIAPETAQAIAATVVKHGSAATDAAVLTSTQMAAHGGRPSGPSRSAGGSGQGKPPSQQTGPGKKAPGGSGPALAGPVTAADEAARLAAWRKLADQEFEAFLEWTRSEGSKGVSSGERLEMQAHGAASEIRARYGLTGDHQSMHGLPRSTARDLPGYDPKASLTILGERELHAGVDEGWKQAFQQMRREGRVDVTAGEVFDEVAKSIDGSPQLSAGTKRSMILRLWDEMFVEYALKEDQLLRLPYPNIPAAP
ncbi:eCIS core domain-containing protein [Streptomyces sp. NPDC001492]